MRQLEINNVFTNKVAEYIAKGYTINAKSMSGTQGEIAKVDFAKDNELIRVWMDRSTNWETGINTLYIKVGKWNHPANTNYTVWMNDLEVIEDIRFYEIANDWFIDDEEEAYHIQELREHRLEERLDKQYKKVNYLYMTDSLKELAANYLKRKGIYQRVSQDGLSIMKTTAPKTREITYSVSYRGMSYRLA